MISQEIQNYVKQQIQAADAAKRFQLSSIPRHIHNGIDSPPVFQSTVIFAGYINDDGTTGSPFPIGWAVIHVGTGLYNIIHGLLEGSYSVAITPGGNAIAPTTFVGFQVEPLTGSVDVEFFDTSTQVNTDSGFFITLTQINNRSVSLPIYNVIT